MEDFEAFAREWMDAGLTPLQAVGKVLDALVPEELLEVAEACIRDGDAIELKELFVQLVHQNREVIRFCRTH